MNPGETLLHVAANHGAFSCCQYLLSKGMSPGTWDQKEENTPMHCTARSKSENNKKIFELLMNNGGDINIGLNRSSGSPLCAAVQENNIEMVKYILSLKPEITDSLRPFSESPLHLAADYNYHECAEALLEINPALIDSKRFNTEKGQFTTEKGQFETALPIAAEHGYPETCKLLLKYKADLSITNNHGMTPLHMAVRHLHEDIINLFLEQKNHIELINAQDKDGRTPLFVCTFSKCPTSIECMDILIKKGADVDKANNVGYTPLHMAAINRDVHKVTFLISKDADLSLKNQAGLSALHFINRKVPQCMKFFEQRLDSGVKLDRRRNEFGARIQIDFQKIVRNINQSEKNSNAFFLEIANTPHQRLLKHPLIESFLHIKWNQYKYLHGFTSILTHFIFALVYTVYVITTFRILCKADVEVSRTGTTVVECICMQKGNETLPKDCIKNSDLMPLVQGSWILLFLFTIVYFFKELYKWRINAWTRLKCFESYLDMIIILSVPLISPIIPLHKGYFFEKWSFYQFQFHVAAIGVLAVWSEMMLHIGRVPRFGKYVQMFLTVAGSFFNFGIAYLTLLMGFWFSFIILFPNAPAFNIFKDPAGFVKVIVMMLGELEYEELYYNQNQYFNVNETRTDKFNKTWTDIEQDTESQAFPFTAHVILIGFVLLVSVILMNLLVGLAVSDIQQMTSEGKLYRIVRQVELVNDLHDVGLFLTKPFDILLSVFPESFKNIVSKKLWSFKFAPIVVVNLFDNNNTLLTEGLKENLYDLCLKRQIKEKEEQRDRDISEILSLLRKQPEKESFKRKSSVFSRPKLSFSASISIEEDDHASWSALESKLSQSGSVFTDLEEEADSYVPMDYYDQNC